MTDIEDVGSIIIIGLRVATFIVGIALLVSGFADFRGLEATIF